MLTFLLSIADESDHDKIIYIYRRYHSDMFHLARSRLKNAGVPDYKTKAEDAVQNAFLKIVKYIRAIDFSVDENDIKTYILSIVVNEAINIINDTETPDNIAWNGTELRDEEFVERLLIRERYDVVLRAIESMEDIYRLPLLYRFYKDYSIKEMSKLFGVKEKTVYTRLVRAKKMLIDMLEGEDLT